MNKKLIWLSALTLAFTMGQTSFACPADNAQAKQCHCNGHKSMTDKLSLTDDQKSKIKAIKTQARKSLKADHQQVKSLRSQINALVTTDKLDEKKLDDLINQLAKIKTAMLKSKTIMKNQIYNVLTVQQKAQYKI